MVVRGRRTKPRSSEQTSGIAQDKPTLSRDGQVQHVAGAGKGSAVGSH